MARLSRPDLVWLWLNTEMVYPRTVTHPLPARHRATTLIKTNALPLSQAAGTSSDAGRLTGLLAVPNLVDVVLGNDIVEDDPEMID